MKLLDVSTPIKTRKGDVYCEPKVDAYGRIVTQAGEAKRPDQLTASDELVMEPVAIGKIINSALDRPDDKLTADERRKRWILSVKIEGAMQDGKAIEIGSEDDKRIREATDTLTNLLFVGRTHEALDNAAPAHKLKAAK